MAKERKVWLSRTDDYENFDEGTLDADSFSLTIPTTNDIRWVESLEALFVGTAGDEWKIASNELGTPLTPANWTIKEQSRYGSNTVQPVKINEQILFVDRVGRKVRELTYSDQSQKYVAPDLTALSEHITESGIVCLAHQRNPDSILWAVLDDGSLVSMTYEREQDVVGWAKHPIGGTAPSGENDVIVQSVCIIPSTDEDQIWISVQRSVNSSDVTYIEKMMPRDFGSDTDDAFFIDSGLTTTAPAATITLAHLVGETVSILADGVVMDDAVVGVAGATDVKLAGVATNATVVQAGLPYTSKLEPMRPDITGGDGTTHGTLVKVPEMVVSLLNSANVQYGVSDDELLDIDIDNDENAVNNSEIDGLFTGDIVVTVGGGFSIDNNLIISTDAPSPCIVRALVPRMDVTGR